MSKQEQKNRTRKTKRLCQKTEKKGERNKNQVQKRKCQATKRIFTSGGTQFVTNINTVTKSIQVKLLKYCYQKNREKSEETKHIKFINEIMSSNKTSFLPVAEHRLQSQYKSSYSNTATFGGAMSRCKNAYIVKVSIKSSSL